MAILVTGGARSGKSSFAEKISMASGSNGIYIATSQIYDDEMRERIGLHKQQREESGFSWDTQEEPYALSELLRQINEGLTSTVGTVVMVDCLTLWLSNCLLQVEGQANSTACVKSCISDLVQAVASFQGKLVLVTNEVGSGIVPEYPLGRQYRDLAGFMNQRLAEVCEQVFLVTVGIPIELKRIAYIL